MQIVGFLVRRLISSCEKLLSLIFHLITMCIIVFYEFVTKDLGRKYRFSAQSLSVSGSFCVNLIEKMLHSP